MKQDAKTSAGARDVWVGGWLLAVCACVLAMVIVGGATRLTESGLSITEWRLDKGLVPPLTAQRWAEEFALYKQTTQYQQMNLGMSLAEFQNIYWWEWAHRFVGKMIGLVFAIPFILFWLQGRLGGRFWKTLGLFALGALQGAIGWWMVKSGLAGRVDVSPFRLAVHLGMAFVIIAGSLWLALEALGWPRSASRLGAPRALVWLFLAGLIAQVLLGALLAGAHGGKAYADWPTIGGVWFPPSYGASGSLGATLMNNHAAQQFNHRTLGYLLALGALGLGTAAALRGSGAARMSALALAGLALTQAGLGVATIVASVPLALALAHQVCAALLWCAAVTLARATTLR
jgi:heme a synthase